MKSHDFQTTTFPHTRRGLEQCSNSSKDLVDLIPALYVIVEGVVDEKLVRVPTHRSSLAA
jgi:hypothetical protein